MSDTTKHGDSDYDPSFDYDAILKGAPTDLPNEGPSNVVALDTAKKRKRKEQPEREPTGDWRDGLLYEKGKIEHCTANAITIVCNDPDWAGVLAWDEFAQSIITTRPAPWTADDAGATNAAGEWSDADTVRLQAWLARRYGLKVGKDSVWDAVLVAAEKNVVHPVRDWLDSIRWDGTRRIPSWVCAYLGAEPGDYSASVGTWWLVSAVARIYQPGCKVDTVPVLEGAQGLGKSTCLRVLFGDEWFSDTPLDLQSKDRFIGLRSRWCIEFAELDSFARSDTSRIKNMLSSPIDDFRPPYGRGNKRVPRQCIFVGTTNHGDYLKDETGNRRFFPIRCGRIDLEGLRLDRAQLWAEAREMFRGGAKWWPTTNVETRSCAIEQADRLTSDPWQEAIETFARRRIAVVGHVTVPEVLGEALSIEKGKWDQPAQNRVARCLRAIVDDDGRPWLERARRREGKTLSWIYRPVPTVPTGGGAPGTSEGA